MFFQSIHETVLTLLFLLYVVLPRLSRAITTRVQRRRHGCAAPRRLPARSYLFGLDTILDNLQQLRQNRKIKTVYSQHQEHGNTFESFPLDKRVVSTVDARNIQIILSTEQEKFGVGPIRERATQPMTGRGIITSDGRAWSRGRRIIIPTFTRSQIADNVMFEGHIGRFLNLLPKDGKWANLQPLFDRLILDASSEFIFGKGFDSLLPSCPVDSQEFLDCFGYAQEGTGTRVLLGKLSFLNRDRRFWYSCDLIREYTQQHVEAALASRKSKSESTKSENKDGQSERKERYILLDEMAKETTNKHELTSQLLNVFFAGRDTPAVALSNVFFCIARHPPVWAKIRDEVGDLAPGDLTFEKLKTLRFTQHTIYEALRLYPPVPNQSRSCLETTLLPVGGGPDGRSPILIQSGDRISMNFYTLHRNPSVFGPDPEAFRPERWETIRPGWDYLPFGGGARHCPAQQLALFWVGYTVVRMALMIREVKNEDPVLEYVERLKLNMESGNGVKVSLVRG